MEDVFTIWRHQIERFGGSDGLRDHGMLASAVAQAEASVDGLYLHADVFEMAAAYLFHLVSNHPSVDGNKRAGLAAALVFLEPNGQPIQSGTNESYELTMAAACGEVVKDTIAAKLRALAQG